MFTIQPAANAESPAHENDHSRLTPSVEMPRVLVRRGRDTVAVPHNLRPDVLLVPAGAGPPPLGRPGVGFRAKR